MDWLVDYSRRRWDPHDECSSSCSTASEVKKVSLTTDRPQWSLRCILWLSFHLFQFQPWFPFVPLYRSFAKQMVEKRISRAHPSPYPCFSSFSTLREYLCALSHSSVRTSAAVHHQRPQIIYHLEVISQWMLIFEGVLVTDKSWYSLHHAFSTWHVT